MLALFSVLGLGALSGCAPAVAQPPRATSTPDRAARPSSAALPNCVVSPAMTEGPFFVDATLNRSDIRSDPTTGVLSPGVPLALTMRLLRVDAQGCMPLPDAVVDIWHCDAQGVYSGVFDGRTDTRGQQFLRGYQMSDAAGEVRFLTIYPGWYPGRAVHIHFKVRQRVSQRRALEFTSQLFFDERATAEAYRQPPYNRRRDGWLRNARDGIYRRGGDLLLLQPRRDAQGTYRAEITIGVRV